VRTSAVCIALLLASCLVGCATSGPKPLAPASWVRIEEDHVTRDYRIILTNLGEKPICFTNERWPYTMGSDHLWLEDRGQRYFTVPDIREECLFGGCIETLQLDPGVTVIGRLPFERFVGVDFSAESADRRLNYVLPLERCRGKRSKVG
jgi:hypothetical protein